MESDLINDISTLQVGDTREPKELGSSDRYPPAPTHESTSGQRQQGRRYPTVGVANTADWVSSTGTRSDSERFLLDELKESRQSSQAECLLLRDKVSALFQENCSLKEKSAKLTMENRSLKKQSVAWRDDNARLKERLVQFSHQLRGLVQSRDGAASSPLLASHAEQVKLMLDFLSATVQKCNGDDGRAPASGHHHSAVSRMSSGGERGSLPSPVSWENDHQSLEQISNKLLDQLKQEKMELEQQYTQMVEIQKSSGYQVVSDSSDRSYDSVAGVDSKDLLNALEICKSNSSQMKDEVKRQNELIVSVFQQMELLQKTHSELEAQRALAKTTWSSNNYSTESGSTGGSNSGDKTKNIPASCHNGVEIPQQAVGMSPSLEVLLRTYGNTIPGWEQTAAGSAGNNRENTPDPGRANAEDDRICPMCQAVFPRSIPLREFEAHVMEHFSSEDFEIIAQENY